jgi:hypothetical protein
MLTFKLGLLTAAFYVLLTMIAEAAIWGMVHFNGGFAIFFRGKHWFWILGAKLGFIFGILWQSLSVQRGTSSTKELKQDSSPQPIRTV